MPGRRVSGGAGQLNEAEETFGGSEKECNLKEAVRDTSQGHSVLKRGTLTV